MDEKCLSPVCQREIVSAFIFQCRLRDVGLVSKPDELTAPWAAAQRVPLRPLIPAQLAYSSVYSLAYFREPPPISGRLHL